MKILSDSRNKVTYISIENKPKITCRLLKTIHCVFETRVPNHSLLNTESLSF